MILIIHRNEIVDGIVTIEKDRVLYRTKEKAFSFLKKNKFTLKDIYLLELDHRSSYIDRDTIVKNAVVDITYTKVTVTTIPKLAWKQIPGFKGYMASNEGDILTINTGGVTKGVSAGHYLKVALKKDGVDIHKNEYVHRLVAITYYGIPKGKNMVVMHLDDNKFNNTVTNLEWGSQSTNIQSHWDTKKGDNMNYGIENDMNFKLADYAALAGGSEGYIDEIGSYFTNRLSTVGEFFSNVSSFVSDNRTPSEKRLGMVEFASTVPKAMKKTDKIRFDVIADLQVPIVPGVTVDHITLNRTIHKHITAIQPVFFVNIKNLLKEISSMISSTDTRKSMRPISNDDKLFSKTLDEMKISLSNIIDTSNVADRRSLELMVRNKTDLYEVVESSIELSKAIDDDYLVKASKDIKKISSYINTLHDMIVSDKYDTVMSKEALGNLTTHIDINANMVTQLSMLYALGHRQIGSVKSMFKMIDLKLN